MKYIIVDLQDLLKLTPPKYVLFIIGDWNVGSQEILGVTGKFGFGVQNEVSQKDKYHILTIYMESRKMVLKNLFTGQQWRNIENRLMDMSRGEERVRCMERVTWKLTLSCVKSMADGNLLYVSGNSKRGSV